MEHPGSSALVCGCMWLSAGGVIASYFVRTIYVALSLKVLSLRLTCTE